MNVLRGKEFKHEQKERQTLRKENEKLRTEKRRKGQSIKELKSEIAQLKQSQMIAAHEKEALAQDYELLRVRFESSVTNSEELSVRAQSLESANKRRTQNNIKENNELKVKKTNVFLFEND